MNSYKIYNILFLSIILLSGMLSCKAQNESRETPKIINEDLVTPFINHIPEDQIGEYVRNIFEDTDGNLWMGTNGYGLVRYDGNKVKYFQPKDGLAGLQVTDVMQAKDGKIWITTDGGISVYNGKSFKNYKIKDGLRDEWVWSVYEDNKGQIWASSTQGVSQFVNGKFVDFDFPVSGYNIMDDRFSNQCVRDFLEVDGKLYMATTGLGIAIYDGKKFTYLNEENGLCGNQTDDIMLDQKGNLWIGSRFGGVCMFDGKKFKVFDIDNGIKNNEVIKVYEASNGDIWFSSEGYGLYKYDGSNQLTNYAKNEGLGVRAVQTIFEDSKGRFWTGGGGGLYRLFGENFVNVTKEGPWE